MRTRRRVLGAFAWDAQSSAEKVAELNQLIERSVATDIEALVRR